MEHTSVLALALELAAIGPGLAIAKAAAQIRCGALVDKLPWHSIPLKVCCTGNQGGSWQASKCWLSLE